MVAEAVDWSELPNDLLNLISERLDNEIDLIHFRSICSTWRSSSTQHHHSNILPFKIKFPLIKYAHLDDEYSDPDDFINFNDTNFQFSNIINNTKSSFCYLSKHSIFLIKPPPQRQQDQNLVHRPWLIRFTKNSSGKNKLYYSSIFPSQWPSHMPYPFELDLNKLSVLHLGTNFIIDEHLRFDYVYPKKVIAVTPLFLAILLNEGYLVQLHWEDGRWTEIPNTSLPSIGDFSVFKGRIFHVKGEGHFGQPLFYSSLFIENNIFAIQKKIGLEVFGGEGLSFLVESEGELLVVDISECSYFENSLTIRVLRLDEKENEWVQLTSLGDRVLFLGDGYSFSASTSNLSVSKGNCIIFMDSVFGDIRIFDYGFDYGMCVVDFDQGRLSLLRDYPEYFDLFWPPPKWIVESCMPKPTKRVTQIEREPETQHWIRTTSMFDILKRILLSNWLLILPFIYVTFLNESYSIFFIV